MNREFVWYLTTISARTAIVLIVLAIGLRLMGKRQIGQMNIYDLALIMLLANAVQNAMTNGGPHVSIGVVSAATLIGVGRLITALFLRAPRLQSHVVGTSSLIVNEGQFVKDHMRRECVTEEQVLAAMRQHGLEDLSQVQMAVLEVDGTISIVPSTTEFHRTAKQVKRTRGRHSF